MAIATDYALELLNNWKGKPSGDRFMVALMKGDAQFESFAERVENLYHEIQEYPSPTSYQKSLVIEAFMVLNWRRGEEAQRHLATLLRRDGFSFLIIGLVKAMVWADKNGQVNRSYQKRFPMLLGQLLTQEVRRRLISQPLSDVLGEHIYDSLSAALRSYFSAEGISEDGEREIARRMQSVFSSLDQQDMTDLPDGTAKSIIFLVARLALAALPLNRQVELILGKSGSKQPRLRTWAVIEHFGLTFGADHNTVDRTQFVFASVADARRFDAFCNLLPEGKRERKSSFPRFGFRDKDIRQVSSIPTIEEIVESSQRTVAQVYTSLPDELIETLPRICALLFRVRSVPKKERSLPIVGTRHGAITFEWDIPPSLAA